MDPYSGWDDIVPPHMRQKTPPADDFSHYFTDYKNFDNIFNDALTNLQDLDVPSGYGQVLPPAQSALSSPYKHAKKPSGTAIFGFLDHTRELSINGLSLELNNKGSHVQPQSISPTQLAKQYAVSNEHLDFDFSQPLEECKPILLNEEEEEYEKPMNKKADDLIVTNSNPKSYKFPPDPLPAEDPAARAEMDGYLTTSLTPIHHPKPDQQYPDDIEALLETPSQRKYVPIPVQQPNSDHHQRKEIPFALQPEPLVACQRTSQVQQNIDSSPQNRQSPVTVGRPQMTKNQPHMLKQNDLNMNMNVFLPPPSTKSLSHDSPEPGSPLPQFYSSPMQNRLGQELSSPYSKKAFYNPQFFSDDADNYYFDAGNQIQLSPFRGSGADVKSSPFRYEKRGNESFADETTTDVNETIVQLTPLRNQGPITPSKKHITLEWSPIISPNAKASSDVRKAILELSPKKVVKKTSLLPPGELDRYWEGPDEDKVFTCTYNNCGKKFTRRYNVRSHIQTHLSDRPFSCSYCPKSFVRQHDLNRHIKSHLATKHTRCKCGKEYTRVEGYKKHLAKGTCSRNDESYIAKPGAHRQKNDVILDGLTSNRLNEDLGL